MSFQSINVKASQKLSILLILPLLLLPPRLYSQKTQFKIRTNNQLASILYNKNGSSLDSISAYLLAEDIHKVTGKKPVVTTNKKDIKGNAIVIGRLGTAIIDNYLDGKKFPNNFKNQKESFLHKVVTDKSNKALVIAGTDARGTAYGVFDLSEKIGVSPWGWWADVPVKKQDKIVLAQKDYYSKEPSVEFRGIFLNDEDWGLQPWAEKTFEPEIGDIGPKTYSKIFELLLRLKANTIWPAMHPSTKAFFHYPGNPEMAKKYHIVMGSSHAEPMLRNNVDEWKKDSMGSFNYLSNKESVYQYWKDRVKEAKKLDAIYTLGMRGIHDSGMEGVEGIEQAMGNLKNVLEDQRKLLETYNDKAVTEIPQAFTVYKEVLDVYDHGLEVPEDVTIVWTDDNYGYIRRLGNEKERTRKGGGGVYYHASYWGRPHDYQWLSTTHPALIREEMMKAYRTNSKKIWILNVGDLKPAEYNMKLFLDMAYDIEKFENPEYVDEHMSNFYGNTFGDKLGNSIADLKKEYYNLAFERKPEFMGWSQTEPTTQIDTTAYNPFGWNDEVKRRLDRYTALENKLEKIQPQIPKAALDAYFQLVFYPVKGASFMNKKFLYRDLAIKYNLEGRLSAEKFKKLAHSSYDSIQALTQKYNHEITEGKWRHYMDMAPRGLPVFENPEINLDQKQSSELVGISVENGKKSENLTLPVYYQNSDAQYFLDLFLKQSGTIGWELKEVPGFLNFSGKSGELTPNQSDKRIWAGIDWKKWKQAGKPKTANFTVKLGEEEHLIEVKTKSYNLSNIERNIFTEQNGIVVIYAENYSEKTDRNKYKWQKLPELGYSQNLMQAVPVKEVPLDTFQLKEKAPHLSYDVITESKNSTAELILNVLPTHPVTSTHSLRLGVQWNDEPIKIVDFKTYGRSEEWKQNVLRNLAKVSLPINVKEAGKHTLKLYMIDQGLSLDFFYINLKNKKIPYSLLPETRIN